MPITLKNIERHIRAFNLPHDIYCAAVGKCCCQEQAVTTVEENPLTGERKPRSRKRKVPGSLTLLALEQRENLHEAVLKIPEVARAIANKRLRVVNARSAPPAVPAFGPAAGEPKDDKPKSKEKEKRKD